MSRCILFWSNLKFNMSSHNLTHMFSLNPFSSSFRLFLIVIIIYLLAFFIVFIDRGEVIL